MMISWLKKFFAGSRKELFPHREIEAPPESVTEAQPKEEPPRLATRPAQAAPIIIGLDFGTSSTKVVFRRLGEGVAWVMPSIAQGNGKAWFCSPAVVEDEVPLKLHLLDSATPPGEFREVERRAVAYLGSVMEHAAETVRQHYGFRSFRPIVNIGVPVAYFGCLEERQSQFRKYEAVAQAALATSTMGGGQGLKPGRSPEERDRIIEKGLRCGRSCKESVAVLPESVAALISLTREPTVEPGIYTVVDIGAGTTEVSTSLFYVSGDGSKVSCYQDSTERIGILDYAENGAPVEEETAQSLLHRWWRQFEVNWEKARRKDAASQVALKAWEQTVVMFTGGGGFHPDVRSSFADRILADAAWCKTMELRNYKPSQQVLKPTKGTESVSRDGFHLLAVAHGLAFHRREWPNWYRPDEVEPLEGPECKDLPYDPQEAGYED
jgi:hypothetical protein